MTQEETSTQCWNRFSDALPPKGKIFVALATKRPFQTEVLVCNSDGDFFQTDGLLYLGAEEVEAAIKSGNTDYEKRGLEYQFWSVFPAGRGEKR